MKGVGIIIITLLFLLTFITLTTEEASAVGTTVTMTLDGDTNLTIPNSPGSDKTAIVTGEVTCETNIPCEVGLYGQNQFINVTIEPNEFDFTESGTEEFTIYLELREDTWGLTYLITIDCSWQTNIQYGTSSEDINVTVPPFYDFELKSFSYYSVTSEVEQGERTHWGINIFNNGNDEDQIIFSFEETESLETLGMKFYFQPYPYVEELDEITISIHQPFSDGFRVTPYVNISENTPLGNYSYVLRGESETVGPSLYDTIRLYIEVKEIADNNIPEDIPEDNNNTNTNEEEDDGIPFVGVHWLLLIFIAVGYVRKRRR
jgi:hypothetical protein